MYTSGKTIWKYKLQEGELSFHTSSPCHLGALPIIPSPSPSLSPWHHLSLSHNGLQSPFPRIREDLGKVGCHGSHAQSLIQVKPSRRHSSIGNDSEVLCCSLLGAMSYQQEGHLDALHSLCKLVRESLSARLISVTNGEMSIMLVCA